MDTGDGGCGDLERWKQRAQQAEVALSIVREALAQVKIDHMNRKIELPHGTYAMVANAMAPDHDPVARLVTDDKMPKCLPCEEIDGINTNAQFLAYIGIRCGPVEYQTWTLVCQAHRHDYLAFLLVKQDQPR